MSNGEKGGGGRERDSLNTKNLKQDRFISMQAMNMVLRLKLSVLRFLWGNALCSYPFKNNVSKVKQ